MAAATITASGPERLDTLCWGHYGHLSGAVEAVLAANYNLAATLLQGAFVPAGAVLILPELPPPARALIRLW